MPFRARSGAPGTELIKTQIAAELREWILKGKLPPGEIISETQWAPRLGAAQASVREALNLLASEGLVRKEPGRSARVTSLTQQDVIQAYQVRAVLEGLAAKLAAEQRLDFSELENSIENMSAAARLGDLRGTIEADLMFHLSLCEAPGNVFLAQQARQLLIPLFAFTLIRALANGQVAQAWVDSTGDHRLILAGIRSGDPIFAEQSARHAIGKFGAIAQSVWASEQGAPRTSVVPRNAAAKRSH